MRTNRTPGAAVSTQRVEQARSTAVAFALAASTVIAFLAALSLPGRAPAAELSATATKSLVCRHVEEIQSVYFPEDDIVAYDFRGSDAGKLKGVMDAASRQAPQTAADVTLVRVVLVPLTGDAFAFQFGADGCGTATVGLDFGRMARLFETAGVAPPFGSTFYQITGRAI
jgi:hypothetical protein